MHARLLAWAGTRESRSAPKSTCVHQQGCCACPVLRAISMAQRLGCRHSGQSTGSVSEEGTTGIVAAPPDPVGQAAGGIGALGCASFSSARGTTASPSRQAGRRRRSVGNPGAAALREVQRLRMPGSAAPNPAYGKARIRRPGFAQPTPAFNAPREGADPPAGFRAANPAFNAPQEGADP
jgi:hypothetical protein